jgi:hypothetical protein
MDSLRISAVDLCCFLSVNEVVDSQKKHIFKVTISLEENKRLKSVPAGTHSADRDITPMRYPKFPIREKSDDFFS